MLEPLARPLHLVLVSPQIPPNTGNVARLCAVTGSRLILVEPLGFSIADRELKLRRERLEAYLNQARFAFADSYDRAAKAQAH